MKSIKNAAWVFGGSAVLALAAFACSSSNNGGAAASCFSQIPGNNSACTSCIENSCGSQINTFNSGCSDYVSCICPGGTYNASTASTCTSKAEESSCMSADQAVSACEQQNCLSQCTGSASGSGGGSGGGSGSSSGGSGGTGGTACIVGSGTSQGCIKSTAETASTCAQEMGTTATSCPSTNLAGCCTITTAGVSVETCYYDSTITSSDQSSCTSENGTWSTSP